MEQKLNTVREAVLCITAPLTPQNKRAAATSFIENLKKDAKDCYQICVALARQQEPDEIRLFALSTIETLISRNWKSMDAAAKVSLQKQSISFISNGTKPILEEKRFLKEKMVQILVTIAIRQWPQEWPDLFDQLFAISQESVNQLELVLRVFKNLSESVLEFDISLHSQRRFDIKKGLSSLSSKIFSLLEAVFTQNLQQLQVSKERRNVALLSVCLECTSVYMSWAPLSDIFSSSLIPIISTMVPMVEFGFFHTAVSCLHGIVHRKFDSSVRAADEVNVDTRPAMLGVWETLVNAFEWTIKSKQIEENEEEITELIACVYGLCNRHFYVLMSPESTERKFATRVKLLTCLVEALKRPSFTLTNAILQIWNNLFLKKSLLENEADTKKLVDKLLRVCHTKLIKDVFTCDAYGDEKEYNVEFGKTRTKTLSFLKTLSTTHPALCWERLLQSVSSFHASPSTDHLNVAGFSTVNSTICRQWEGLYRLTRSYNEDVSKTKLFDDPCPKHVRKNAEDFLLILLKHNTEDHLIVTAQINIMVQFDAIYKNNPEALKMVLNKLFTTLTHFNVPQQADNEDTELVRRNVIALRKRVLFGLNKLAKKISMSLMPLFGELIHKVEGFMKLDTIFPDEKAFLVEFLVTISNQITNVEERFKFLKMMVQSPLASWRSKKVTEIFEDPQNFFSLINFTDTPKPAHDFRQQIRSTLDTLTGVFRGTKNQKEYRLNGSSGSEEKENQSKRVWSLLQPTLSNAYRALRLFNSFHDPAMKERLPPEFWVLFDSHTKAVDLKLGAFSAYSTNKEDVLKKHVRGIWHWINNVRENCYKLIAHATYLGENFFVVKQSENLMNSAFSNIEYLDNWGLREIFSKLLVQICVNCPPNIYTPFLKPILIKVFTVTFRSLSISWGKYNRGELQASEASEDFNADTLLASCMRDLTRIFCLAMHALCIQKRLHWKQPFNKNCSKPRGSNIKIRVAHKFDVPVSHDTELFCRWLFRHQDLCEPLVAGLFAVLGWDDSHGVSAAAELFSRYLQVFLDKPEFYPIFADAMHHMIRALANVRDLDDASHPGLKLVKDVYSRLSQRNCDIPRKLLLSIPNVDPADVQNMDDQLFKQHETEKLDKVAVLKFLNKYVIGKGSIQGPHIKIESLETAFSK